MRFEVRTGGMIAILLGVAFLSGTVFLLGLLAGYDIGRETQSSTQQMATDYTLQPPPAVAPIPGVTTPVTQATSKASPATATRATPSLRRVAATPATAPRVVKASIAATSVPTPALESLPPEAAEGTAATPRPTPEAQRLTAKPLPPAHRKPFNIQIQATMDSASATEMIKRLQKLGYQPHTVPTTVNGANWYKVEVGPYTTQAEAASAEADLREKYNAIYGHGSSPAPPTNGATDE